MAYRQRRTVLTTGPLRVWIEVTNVCNLRCPMCLTPRLGDEVPKGLMTLATFERIVDQIKGHAQDVNLFLGGEPLINKQLPEMIAYARAHGLRTRIHTNATLLTQTWSERLLDAGLDYLSFSFDGADEETFLAYRVGADFAKTAENIRRFAALKVTRKATRPYTVVQLIERPEWNEVERQAQRKGLAALFAGEGIDRFKFIALHNFAGLLPDARFLAGKTFSPCSFLWYALNVGYDGVVVPCCLDFARQYPVGNLLEQPLMDVWNGPLLVALREKMVRKQIDDVALCRGCDVPYKKKVLGIPIRDRESLRELVVEAWKGPKG